MRRIGVSQPGSGRVPIDSDDAKALPSCLLENGLLQRSGGNNENGLAFHENVVTGFNSRSQALSISSTSGLASVRMRSDRPTLRQPRTNRGVMAMIRSVKAAVP